jgi:hypothetical protein
VAAQITGCANQVARTRFTTIWIMRRQIKVTVLADIAFGALNVFLAIASAGYQASFWIRAWITLGIV